MAEVTKWILIEDDEVGGRFFEDNREYFDVSIDSYEVWRKFPIIGWYAGIEDGRVFMRSKV